MTTLKRGARVLVNTSRGELMCIVVGPRTKSPASGIEEVLVKTEDGGDRWVMVDEIHLPVQQLVFPDTEPLLKADVTRGVPTEQGEEAASAMRERTRANAERLNVPLGSTEDRRGIQVVDDDWQSIGNRCFHCNAYPGAEHDPECPQFVANMSASVRSERPLTDSEAKREKDALAEIEAHRRLAEAQRYVQAVVKELKKRHQVSESYPTHWSVDSDFVHNVADLADPPF